MRRFILEVISIEILQHVLVQYFGCNVCGIGMYEIIQTDLENRDWGILDLTDLGWIILTRLMTLGSWFANESLKKNVCLFNQIPKYFL